MSDDIYRPWRRGENDDDLLADDVSAKWKQLLDDSKRCVSELRRTTQLADQRLMVGVAHERIMQRLDAFERRLARLEQQLNTPVGPTLRKHAA